MRINNTVAKLGSFALLTAALTLGPAPASGGVVIETYGQPGWILGAALDVNSAGQVVGIYDDGGGRHGFLYDSGVYSDLFPPGWTETWAWAVDESGRAAGYGKNGGVNKGWVYSSGSYTTLLPPGWTEAQARDMSDRGHVVGSGMVGGVSTGFLYRIGSSGYTAILPPGWSSAQAVSVSNSGEVAGAGNDGAQEKAFSWKDGVYSYPAPPGWTNTSGVAVNDAGLFLGMGDDGTGDKCFLESGGVYTTVFPPGMTAGSCVDLNNSGTVLGFGATAALSWTGFIYKDGVFHYTDSSEILYAEIVSLNDRGVFAGGRLTAGSTFEAITGYFFPSASITANDERDAVGVRSTDPLALRVSMDATGTYAGRKVEWWLVAQTPSGPWSFDAASRRWLPGLRPASKVPLRDIGSQRVPPVSMAPGLYTYYFGADGRVNGLIDFAALVYDAVTVHIR